jgi:hypothetical protein
MRVDVMSRLRGVAEFGALWSRRTTLTDTDGTVHELLALPDLVQTKKTQGGKDWPMLQRLLEAHYLRHRVNATARQQRFWLLELRTPELLVEAARQWPEVAEQIAQLRPLLASAQAGQVDALRNALAAEEQAERAEDRAIGNP